MFHFFVKPAAWVGFLPFFERKEVRVALDTSDVFVLCFSSRLLLLLSLLEIRQLRLLHLKHRPKAKQQYITAPLKRNNLFIVNFFLCLLQFCKNILYKQIVKENRHFSVIFMNNSQFCSYGFLFVFFKQL